ncbi:MAG: HNH endonuclease [Actinomycetota bacterium]|nr:HNH endonuclease [Actinomycetota bacterium]
MLVFSTGFDASLLTCADASTVVKDAAAIEHMAATVKALAAARAAEARSWKAGGYRSAEEELARRTGSSLSGARDALALGRNLTDQREVADAARQGRLSPDQASAISDAVAADASAATDLVDAAEAGGSLADLKDKCAKVKAAAVDLEARREANRRRRHLRGWTDQHGEWHLSGSGNPEDGAQIMAALAPLVEEAFRAARREGRRDHPDAYRFDALLRLALDATSDPFSTDSEPDDHNPIDHSPVDDGPFPANDHRADDDPIEVDAALTDDERGDDGPSDGDAGPFPSDAKADYPAHPDDGRSAQARRRHRRGAPVKLLVRVDLETLMRGFPTDGETCELVGYGPIAMSALDKLLKDGDPFVAAILMKGKQLAGVAHLGRQPTAHQRSYLQWLYPTCAAEGCSAPAERLQIDHRVDWSKTHITLIDWLDGLCRHDHDKKTRYGWSLIDGIGKRPFVPPTDPRHPNYKPRPDGAP